MHDCKRGAGNLDNQFKEATALASVFFWNKHCDLYESV